MRQKRCTQRGVTLIELLVVVAAISAIGGLGIVGVSGVQQSARERKLQSDVVTINSAIQLHIANGGAMADTSSPQAVLNSLKARDTAAKSVGLRGSSIDPRTTAVALPAAEVASDTLRAVWIAADNGFTATRAGSGVKEFMLDDSLSTTVSSGDRTPLLKVSQASGWVWDHSAPPDPAGRAGATPATGVMNLTPEMARRLGVPTNIAPPFTVGAGGLVSTEYLYDGAGYQGQMGAFSLRGMDVYDLTTIEGRNDFYREAIRRVLTNSVLGGVILDSQADRAGPAVTRSHQFEEGDSVAIILVPNGNFTQSSALLEATTPDRTSDLFPLTSIALQSGETNEFSSSQLVGLGNGVFAMEDLVGGGDRDFEDIIFRLSNLEQPDNSALTMIDPATFYVNHPNWLVPNTNPVFTPTPIREVLIAAGALRP